jgi:hypothetical protein
MFSISTKRYLGQIIIGNYKEQFNLAKGYWTTNDYRQNWNIELDKIINSKRQTCCLVTWMTKPGKTGTFRGWILFKRKNKIIITERIWPADNLKPRFRKDGTIIIEDEIPRNCSKWKLNISEIKFKNA